MKIIVDIDNTLWPFAPVLYECLREVSPAVAPMDMWGAWKFWGEDMDTKTFYGVLKKIHMRQEEFMGMHGSFSCRSSTEGSASSSQATGRRRRTIPR